MFSKTFRLRCSNHTCMLNQTACATITRELPLATRLDALHRLSSYKEPCRDHTVRFLSTLKGRSTRKCDKTSSVCRAAPMQTNLITVEPWDPGRGHAVEAVQVRGLRRNREERATRSREISDFLFSQSVPTAPQNSHK